MKAECNGCAWTGSIVCQHCPHVGSIAVPRAGLKPKTHANKYKQMIDLIFLSQKLDVEKEYQFDKRRKWRFDWAIPAMKIAVEYEGLNFTSGSASGHQTIKGVSAGNEKYSEASIAGWCLILVNAISVESGLAHDLIRRAVDSRRIMFHQIPGAKRRRIVSEDI